MKLLSLFKELSLHPKNAEELKGLVLQFAIQGKLTAKWREENSNTASVSNLLERLEEEKLQQVKQKTIKAEKPLPIIEADEIPFNIPKSWIWKRLGEVGSTNVGLTYKPAHKVDNGVPVLRSSNIQDGDLCLKDLVRVNTEYRDKDVIKEGDLLICARNGSRRLVGKCTIIGNINEVMVFGAFMAIFRSSINPYLQLFIQSPQYRSKLDGVETTTINQITQGNLKATTVPIPPLEEQKAIVEVVNQLFAEVEQLEELTKERISLKEDFVTSALRKLTESENTAQEWNFLQEHFSSFFTEKANVKKLRETILQLAVQGKLSAKWREANPSVEHASELLKRIEAEKQQLLADKKIRKEKPLPPIDVDEVPYELPEGWEYSRVASVSTIKGGKRVPKGYQLTDTPTPYIYIRVTDMKKGSVNLHGLKYITKEVYDQISQYTISKYDLYITIAGTIGDVGEVPDELDGMNLTENAAKIIYYQVNKHYLKLLLSSSFCQNQFMDKVNQMAQPKLALHRIGSTLIPIPSLEEQKAIVEKVNSLMALCDELEQQIDNSQTQIEQLMQSCLKEVFEVKEEVLNEQ